MSLALALACALLVAALLVGEKRDDARIKWATKPLASLAFIGVGLAQGATSSAWGLWILAALVLCLGGDVLLIPRNPKTFLAGLGSFLLGHVAFAVAFLTLRPDPAAVAIGTTVAAAITVPAMTRIFPHVPGPMRVPVLAYCTVICLMVGSAWGAWRLGASPLLIVGAIAFLLSDLSVAIDRFVAHRFVNRLWGLPLYYGSVVLLAWTAGGSGISAG